MRLFPGKRDRTEYLDIQIQRSRDKFQFCKVSHAHVRAWADIVSKFDPDLAGPICCMGTRNGREIDLFRAHFCLGNRALSGVLPYIERRKNGWSDLIPGLLAKGRSDVQNIDQHSVVGVEINPDARRSDTWVGSFDDLPVEWSKRFSLIYSNSFDQSLDPVKVAGEWRRILKTNGLILLGFNNSAPTATDPTGDLAYQDLLDLFPGELLYFDARGSNYSDILIRLD